MRRGNAKLCLQHAAVIAREMSALLPFSPCGRRWHRRPSAAVLRKRTPMLCIGSGSETDEGSVSAERTPHPPTLRSGTFSHKGEGKKSIHHLSHSLAARGRVGIAAEIPRPQ